jgi:polyisoprenoid-binding protein YceI
MVLPLTWVSSQNELVIVDHELTISGTSTLKDWSMKVEKLDIVGQAIRENEELTGFRNVVVTVDVASIKSKNSEEMDKNTFEALKGDQYPKIRFELADDATVFNQTSDLFMTICQGEITLAGVSKVLSFQAQGRWKGPDQMTLKGSTEFNMKDFAVEPPTFLLGVNRTGDTVKIDLSLTLSIVQTDGALGKN